MDGQKRYMFFFVKDCVLYYDAMDGQERYMFLLKSVYCIIVQWKLKKAICLDCVLYYSAMDYLVFL